MTQAIKSARHLLWVTLGTAALALVMVVLLVFEVAQQREIEKSQGFRSDSVTALAFQFEREFLRFRSELHDAVNGRLRPDADVLSLRYDIFLSRLTLLRDSPSLGVLSNRPEYVSVMPKLVALVERADVIMGRSTLRPTELADLLAEFQSLGPEVQSLSLASNSEVTYFLEMQTNAVLAQNALIIWLTSAMLVLLLAAGREVLLWPLNGGICMGIFFFFQGSEERASSITLTILQERPKALRSPTNKATRTSSSPALIASASCPICQRTTLLPTMVASERLMLWEVS